MSAKNSKTVVTVGTGSIGKPKHYSEELRMTFNIHGFASLEDKPHLSSLVSCHGYQWHIQIYPFQPKIEVETPKIEEETDPKDDDTNKEANAKKKWTSCLVPWRNKTDKAPKEEEPKTESKVDEAKEEKPIPKPEKMTKFFLHCIKTPNQSWPLANYKVFVKDTKRYWQSAEHQWKDEKNGETGLGWEDFAKHSELLSRVDSNGTLVVHVDISIITEREPVWHPQKIIQQKLERMFNNDKEADVAFVLAGGKVVHAHRFVLGLHSPTLSEFAKAAEDHRVEIESADPDLFATMIRFLYTNSLPTTFDLIKDGLKLMELANAFGCIDLKMVLEAKIVESDMVTVQNAAEMLLKADGNAAALLKEAAIDCIANNPAIVMQSEGWIDVQASCPLLAKEALKGKQQGSNGLEKLSVSDLRKSLAAKEMDFDGTKEMLVKRLKEATNNE